MTTAVPLPATQGRVQSLGIHPLMASAALIPPATKHIQDHCLAIVVLSVDIAGTLVLTALAQIAIVVLVLFRCVTDSAQSSFNLI
jgi:hypothetical protein